MTGAFAFGVQTVTPKNEILPLPVVGTYRRRSR